MCGYNKEDWAKSAKLVENAGFDAIEANLSCPHGMNEKGMGRALGENPNIVKEITSWIVENTKLPVIIKIISNYGNSEILANAAKEGGAKAVTLVNTLPGLQDSLPSGLPFYGVGEENYFASGGTSGNILRPFALKKCSDVAQCVPNIDIFGSGGIITGDNALAFINFGAKALQICSSIQNQDFSTVIYDLKTSLQAHIYLLNQKQLVEKGWHGQFPPANFVKLQSPNLYEENKETPKITDLSGSKLKYLSPIQKMNKGQFKVPIIDEDKCLKCGRCYLSCVDAGYQSIIFKNSQSFPEIVEKDCTGCALCLVVCPVEDAIQMVPRTLPYKVCRGTETGPDYPKEHLQTYPPWNNK